MKQVLANPSMYHFLRQAMTLGLPFRQFVREFRYNDPNARIADIGCGPVDLFRYLDRDNKPGCYVGVDQSEAYLARARRRAASIGLPATFQAMDLQHLTHSSDMQRQLLELINDNACNQAMLLGVLHHIPDEDAISTLGLLLQAESIQRVFTWDVVIMPGRTINNFLARNDRGQFVRDEAGFRRVVEASGWRIGRTFWTHPGLRAIDYLHYELIRT